MKTLLAPTAEADRHIATLNKLAMLAAPLAAASTVDEAKAVADTAKAIELWARRRNANRTVLLQAMEYQRRAERKIGEMLPPAAAGGRGKKLFHDETVCGMTRLVAHRCRKIAQTEEASFESWLAECRESEDEPTQAVAVRLHLGAHLRNNSGNSEWYTPQEYVDAVREAMGGIDIDPCSCQAANGVVKAATFFDEADNGLDRQWIGRVFVNPPYGDGTVDSFASKLLAELSSGNASQAVFLVNNCTETKWFQGLLTQAAALCFPRGRISFWSLEKKSKSPLQGQAVIYFGSNAKRFKSAFSEIGFCTLIR
jgi:hypothetical protein